MAIALVQSATGNGASVTLNGVAAANLVTTLTNWFKNGNSYTESTPTDGSGDTVSVAVAQPSATYASAGNHAMGASIFYTQNASAGTHQVTTDNTVGSHHTAVLEWSGAATTGALDQTNHGETTDINHASQATGTITPGASAGLSLIAHSLAAEFGTTDVGYTDPPSGGWTKIQKNTDDSTSVAGFHAYQLSGQTSATFAWSTGSETHMGSQAVIATFNAPLAPSITSQPTNQSVYETQTASFSISATTSGGTLHYQWKFNGSNVGSDQNTYDRTNCALADDRGVVTCVVSDDNGSTTSNGAVLYVMGKADLAWTTA